jgi:CRP-like cAMP-binding protein
MQADELRGVLREVDLFHGLSDEDLDRVAAAAQLREHSAGDVVFGQGQESDDCAIIASGEFEKFEYDDVLEAERGLDMLHAGDSYGVVELLARRPRVTALRAVSSGKVLRFTREAVQGLAREQPDVCLALAETMAQRLDAKEQANKLPVVHVNADEVDHDAVRRLPRPVIERFQLLPLRKDDHSITIGLVHPNDNLARNSAATFLEEFRHEWVCISQGEFDGFLGLRQRAGGRGGDVPRPVPPERGRHRPPGHVPRCGPPRPAAGQGPRFGSQ